MIKNICLLFLATVLCLASSNSSEAQIIGRHCSQTVNQVSQNTFVQAQTPLASAPIILQAPPLATPSLLASPVVNDTILSDIPVASSVGHICQHSHTVFCECDKCKKLRKCKEDLATANQNIQKLNVKVSRLEKKIGELDGKLKCCDEESKKLAEEKIALEEELTTCESDHAVTRNELKNAEQRVSKLNAEQKKAYWTIIAVAALAGLLLLFSLWLLSRLAVARREKESLNSSIRELDTQLHDARATMRIAEHRVRDSERDLIRCQTSYEQCVRDSAVSRQRIISATS